MYYDLETLEYNKVINIIANYLNTPYGLLELKSIKPSNNTNEIINNLNETEELRKLIISYHEIPFSNIYNIDSYLEKVSINGIIYEDEFLKINNILLNITNIKNYFKDLDLTYLNKYLQNLKVLTPLQNEILKTIDINGRIYDNASKDLKVIRNEIDILKKRLKEKLNDLLKQYQTKLTNSLITIKNDRFCLPFKMEYKNQIKGIIHDESQTKNTVYIEPISTFELNNKINNLMLQEKKEEEIILYNLTRFLNDYQKDLINNLKIIGKLDFIQAKSSFAIKYNCFKPHLNTNKEISLINARHPLIDQNKVIPIDFNLNNHLSVIITGPNTGGKTITLKTLGLLTLLAQSGILIPADEKSNLNIFDNIFSDIGDEQSIEMSLSTFSSHIKKIKNIIDNLNSNSLVLLDELGSGTDPNEGSILAISILDYLLKNNCISVITSHYSSLKEYAYQNKNVINASVEFDINTLLPTYKLLMGVPGKSNALDIALKLGLKEEIIKEAKDKLIKNQSDIGLLITELENKNYRLNEIIKKNNYLNEELKNKIKQKEEEIIKIEKDKEIIYQETIKKAELSLKEKEKKIEELIKKLNDLEKNTNITPKLAQIKYEYRNLDQIKLKENSNLEININDIVYIPSYNMEGLVLDINKNKNNYLVLINNLKINFKKEDLIFVRKQEIKKEEKIKQVNYNIKKSGSYKLDLRGKRYDEAKIELENFIDKSLLNNFESVQIIHGFGTGTIRKLVWDYLKNNKNVKSYRFGGANEGLNGVTIVYFK